MTALESHLAKVRERQMRAMHRLYAHARHAATEHAGTETGEAFHALVDAIEAFTWNTAALRKPLPPEPEDE